MKNEGFKIILPLYLQKSDKSEEEKAPGWKIAGIASTFDKDKQGEIVDLNGLDLTPIKEGKGYFNWDHNNGPESLLGSITGYKIDPKQGFYVEGYLFKNHAKAKAVHEILSSLDKSETGKLGMSIEGVIRERGGEGNKVIKKAVIHNVAITACPVNPKTYLDLVKSFSGVEFLSNSLNQNLEDSSEVTFSPKQVFSLLEKALSAGPAYANTLPQNMRGGDALQMEDLDHDKDKKDEDQLNVLTFKSDLPLASEAFFKSLLTNVFYQIKALYPDVDESVLWDNVKDRLFAKFPSINMHLDDNLGEED